MLIQAHKATSSYKILLNLTYWDTRFCHNKKNIHKEDYSSALHAAYGDGESSG